MIRNFGYLHFFQILTKFLNIFSKSRSMWNHPKFMPRMDSCQFIIVAAAKNCSPVGLLLLQLGISAQAKIQVSKQKWQPSHGIPENPQIWSCMPLFYIYLYRFCYTTFIIKSKDHQGMKVYALWDQNEPSSFTLFRGHFICTQFFSLSNLLIVLKTCPAIHFQLFDIWWSSLDVINVFYGPFQNFSLVGYYISKYIKNKKVKKKLKKLKIMICLFHRNGKRLFWKWP